MHGTHDAVDEAIAEHIQQGRLDAAEELLRVRADSGASTPQMLKQMGLIALKRGDAGKARTLCEEALANDDRDAEAYTLMSTIHAQEDRGEASLLCAQRAVELDPSNTRYIMNLALIEQTNGNYQRAIGRLEVLVAQEPNSAEFAYNLGTAYLEVMRPDLARVELRRAATLEPDRMDGWTNLASAEHGLGNARGALDAINKALLIEPLNPLLMTSKASALSSLDRQAEALQLVERAMILQPGAVYPLFLQGVALSRSGQLTAAAASFAKVLRKDGKNVAALSVLSSLLQRQGKVSESLLTLERAHQLTTEAAGAGKHAAPRNLGEARVPLLLQLGRFNDAFDLWHGWQPPSPKVTPATDLEGVEQLLVVADTDLRTTIALIRFIPLVAARGIEVLLAGNDLLASFAADIPGVARALMPDDDVPADMRVVALQQLPRLLDPEGVNVPAIPWSGPYLTRAAPPSADSASHQGDESPQLNIGVSTESLSDEWTPHGEGDLPWEQVAAALAAPGRKVTRLDLRVGLADLIAQLKLLDLVVSVDNEVAHIAGALGLPQVILLDTRGGWAWPADQEASPWYPAAKVIRLIEPGDFSAPIDELAALVSATDAQAPPQP